MQQSVTIGYLLLILGLVLGLANAKIRNNERIFGGQPAEKGQFPYQAGIKPVNPSATSPHCSGSIIGRRSILSEAWCINNAYNFTVVLGCVNWDADDCLVYDVESVTLHPNYTLGELMINDIAILTVTTDIEFNENVGPIEISKEHIEGDVPLIVSGWSYVEKQLTWLEVKSTSEDVCHYEPTSPKEALCTTPNSHLFWADWGGPLVGPDGKVAALAVSFGPEHDYHIRVEYFLDFINDNLLGSN